MDRVEAVNLAQFLAWDYMGGDSDVGSPMAILCSSLFQTFKMRFRYCIQHTEEVHLSVV